MSRADPKQRIVVVGATSAIAQETGKCFAAKGANLFLVGRSREKLEAVADDLRVRGASSVHTCELDVRALAEHERVIAAAVQELGKIDVALIACGTLPDQNRCEADQAAAVDAVNVNYVSAISLLTLLASHFEAQRSGCIAVISSVAGDRGRSSNYVYGSAKAGLNTFLEGLRARLRPAHVNVLVIKPGFVDTPMTEHLPKNRLFASPTQVGSGIYDAILARREEVYLPGYWRPLMTALRLLPRRVFERLPI